MRVCWVLLNCFQCFQERRLKRIWRLAYFIVVARRLYRLPFITDTLDSVLELKERRTLHKNILTLLWADAPCLFSKCRGTSPHWKHNSWRASFHGALFLLHTKSSGGRGNDLCNTRIDAPLLHQNLGNSYLLCTSKRTFVSFVTINGSTSKKCQGECCSGLPVVLRKLRVRACVCAAVGNTNIH